MMKQFNNITQIYQNNNDFIITAYIIDQCNYNCEYCYNKKPRSNEQINLIQLYNYCKHIHNITLKNIKLELIGGEPTLHPQLLDFCKVISNINWIKCYILTNLSKTLEYYQQLLLIHNIYLVATWHSTYDDLYNCHYINVIQHLPINSYLSDKIEIRIMAELLNFDISMHLLQKLIKHNVFMKYVSCNLVYDIIHNNIVNYNLVQLKQIKKIQNIIYKTSKLNIKYIVQDSNKKQYKLNFNELFFNKKYSFYNWKCNAGKDCMYIHVNGNIYPCESYYDNNQKIIGHINYISLINIKPQLCKCKWCSSCDFGIKKQKIFV